LSKRKENSSESFSPVIQLVDQVLPPFVFQFIEVKEY